MEIIQVGYKIEYDRPTSENTFITSLSLLLSKTKIRNITDVIGLMIIVFVWYLEEKKTQEPSKNTKSKQTNKQTNKQTKQRQQTS